MNRSYFDESMYEKALTAMRRNVKSMMLERAVMPEELKNSYDKELKSYTQELIKKYDSMSIPEPLMEMLNDITDRIAQEGDYCND